MLCCAWSRRFKVSLKHQLEATPNDLALNSGDISHASWKQELFSDVTFIDDSSMKRSIELATLATSLLISFTKHELHYHGRNAYTPLNKDPNHAQLNSWAKGAIAWSQTNLKAALTAAGRTYVHSKWRTGNPRKYNSFDQIPRGTPQYKPTALAFSEINAEVDVV
ncbi:hypothetical protein A0H81_00467 [Grifola frondosa]|uniref:Uncharacterized protein n=1 Tax=Grifola frondosa TaxID=5627 RepID=A0A1C7MSP5_GRIFR|nr:hypothetical protein A0H81_00467 [Grifola frondosa]